MAQVAKFGSSTLKDMGKKGILKPDADGYYTVVLGGFNCFNGSGAYYSFEKAKSLFEANSSLMRRIANNAFYGEFGHPSLEGLGSKSAQVRRILTISEERISHHIKEVTLDDGTFKNEDDSPITAVIGKVKPLGAFGDRLKDVLETPDINSAFSVRSLTNDGYRNNVLVKDMSTLVTYDSVLEPGIQFATKYNSPAMESIDSVILTPQLLDRIEAEDRGLGLESTSRIIQIRNDMGWETHTNIITPPSSFW